MTADWLQSALARMRRFGLGAALFGVAGCVWSAANDVDGALRSYVLAYFFWWSAALGCLGGLTIYYLTGGAWGRAAKPFLESGAMTLPLFALAFVPLALNIDRLYPWAGAVNASSSSSHSTPPVVSTTATTPSDIDVHDGDELLPFASDVREWYLNSHGFVIRAIVYFAIWIGLTALLCRRDPTSTDRPGWTQRASAAGAVMLTLTCTFAAIDWGMSLEADWYSTMYGALVAIGGLLAAFALVTVIAAHLQRSAPRGEALFPADTLADLGSLLLAFLMLWAYFAFSQFLIVWSGNLPEENVWYTRRMAGGWQWAALLVIACQFVIPFLLLLSRDLKHKPAWLARVATLVLALQFVFTLWTITPSFYARTASLRISDAAAPLAFGGVLLWLFSIILPRRLVGPLHSEVADEQ